MKTFKVNLKESYSFLQGGTLEGLLMEQPFDGENTNWKRPAVVVFPGGGYAMCSKRESAPIAATFWAKGFQVFILTYLCAPDNARYPEQLLEGAAAVDYVRKHAEEFNVNPDEVFVVGFSAGGHLTGNLAVEHQNVEKLAGVALDCKPTAVGLCYPVISKKHGHQGSYENLLAGYSETEQEEILQRVNLDEYVSEQTPPAFIWATAEDACVPPDNAIRYALALDRRGISYELHIYPRGYHGLSTCDLEVNTELPDLERMSRWMDDCARYFRLYTVEKF